MEKRSHLYEDFDAIIRGTSSYIFSLSFRMTGSYDDAHDLLQDTYLKAWEKLDRLQKKEKVLPWIRKICVNQYIDMYRKRKHKNISLDVVFPHMEYEIASKAPSPEDEIIVDEEIRLIHSQCWTIVTRSLPLYQQIVFILVDVYQLRIEETARLIQRTTSATKSLLHRARKSINGRITPHCSLINRDNICKCRAWVQYSHNIRRRREYLQQIISSNPYPLGETDSSSKKLIKLFNNMPLHIPPSSWIQELEKLVKNIR